MSIYDRLITEIFHRHGGADHDEFEFDREEMSEILREWNETVKNLGDVPYSYRGGRRHLPEDITSTGHVNHTKDIPPAPYKRHTPWKLS